MIQVPSDPRAGVERRPAPPDLEEHLLVHVLGRRAVAQGAAQVAEHRAAEACGGSRRARPGRRAAGPRPARRRHRRVRPRAARGAGRSRGAPSAGPSRRRRSRWRTCTSVRAPTRDRMTQPIGRVDSDMIFVVHYRRFLVSSVITRRRLGALTAAVAAGAAITAPSALGAQGNRVPVASGATDLHLNAATAGVLTDAGLSVAPVGPATAKGLRVSFPITGGSDRPGDGRRAASPTPEAWPSRRTAPPCDSPTSSSAPTAGPGADRRRRRGAHPPRVDRPRRRPP